MLTSEARESLVEQKGDDSTSLIQRLMQSVRHESRVSRICTGAITATFAAATGLTTGLSYLTHDTSGKIGNLLAQIRGGIRLPDGPCIDFFIKHSPGSPTNRWFDYCINSVEEAVFTCLSYRDTSKEACLAKESPYCVAQCASMDSLNTSYRTSLAFAVIFGITVGGAALCLLVRGPKLKEMCYPTLKSLSKETKAKVVSLLFQRTQATPSDKASINDVLAQLEAAQVPTNSLSTAISVSDGTQSTAEDQPMLPDSASASSESTLSLR